MVYNYMLFAQLVSAKNRAENLTAKGKRNTKKPHSKVFMLFVVICAKMAVHEIFGKKGGKPQRGLHGTPLQAFREEERRQQERRYSICQVM